MILIVCLLLSIPRRTGPCLQSRAGKGNPQGLPPMECQVQHRPQDILLPDRIPNRIRHIHTFSYFLYLITFNFPANPVCKNNEFYEIISIFDMLCCVKVPFRNSNSNSRKDCGGEGGNCRVRGTDGTSHPCMKPAEAPSMYWYW